METADTVGKSQTNLAKVNQKNRPGRIIKKQNMVAYPKVQSTCGRSQEMIGNVKRPQLKRMRKPSRRDGNNDYAVGSRPSSRKDSGGGKNIVLQDYEITNEF